MKKNLLALLAISAVLAAADNEKFIVELIRKKYEMHKSKNVKYDGLKTSQGERKRVRTQYRV